MTNTRTLFVAVLAVSCTLSLSSCRSRATRSAAARKPATPAAAQNATGATAPSAKAVLSHADSALARVSQLGAQADLDTPPYAASTPPGSFTMPPMGQPYTPQSYAPQPSISDYGTYEAALAAYNRQ